MTTDIIVNDKRSAALEQARPAMDPLLALMDKMANNPNLTPEMVGSMMNVYIDGQRKMATMADEREFFMRLSEFKKNPPEIVKNLTMKMKGTAKGSGREYELTAHYADLNAYTEACMGGLAEKGITWDFEGDNTPKECWMRCVLHYGLFTYRGPKYVSGPETSGVKNDLQAQGSAGSYLMRYSFCSATGMTAAMPPDNNGKAPKVKEEEDQFQPMPEGKLLDWLAAIEGVDDQAQAEKMFFDAHQAADRDNAAHLQIDRRAIQSARSLPWAKALYTIAYKKWRDCNDSPGMNAVSEDWEAAKRNFPAVKK
jgi:hypothetical protein